MAKKNRTAIVVILIAVALIVILPSMGLFSTVEEDLSFLGACAFTLNTHCIQWSVVFMFLLFAIIFYSIIK